MIDVGEGGGSGLPTSIQQYLIYKKSIVLYKQTQKNVGGIDDLDAFAQLTEYAASLTPDCAACFVNNMGAVVTGYTGSAPGAMVLLNRWKPDEYPLSTYYVDSRTGHTTFRQTGFALIFRDNNGRANQVRHYWQYVQSGYFEGWNTATAGNAFHETIDPASDRNEKSYHDFVLGLEGADLGFLLRIGAVSPEGAGQYIRDNLSKDSFSAMFWSNPFGPWGTSPLWIPNR
jgi:hypothetical protein